MEKEISPLHRTISYFEKAFADLGHRIGLADLERIGVFVHRAMDGGRRLFHTTEHIFQVCEGMKPLQILAALFHDVVYYQVDKGFPPDAANLLLLFSDPCGDKVLLRVQSPADRRFELCLGVFGFHRGQMLSVYGGLNEFLSAFTALVFCEPYLTDEECIGLALCIEATIPFRPDSGEDPLFFETIFERTKKVCAEKYPDVSEETLADLLRDAVLLANKDVENFSAKDPVGFLSNTWKLLPETNSFLDAPGVYTITDYRQALARSEAFLRNLNPNCIYHRFRNSPTLAEWRAMTSQAKINLTLAGHYLGSKLLTVSILEALAQLTGGNAPLSLFLGDMTKSTENTIRAEQFLTENEINSQTEADEVLRLLETGEDHSSFYYLNRSPVSAYIYRTLGPEKVKELFGMAKKMFESEISSEEFLHSVPAEVVRLVAMACAQTAITRRQSLLRIAESFS